MPSSPARVNGDGELRIKAVEVLLGSAPLVPMMQTADFWNCTELRQTDPETSICGFQFRFGSLSLKHNDLVSQGEDLELEIGPTLEIQTKGSQERKQHREHGGRSLRRQVQQFQYRWNFREPQSAQTSSCVQAQVPAQVPLWLSCSPSLRRAGRR